MERNVSWVELIIIVIVIIIIWFDSDGIKILKTRARGQSRRTMD